MTHNFNEIHDRHNTYCTQWDYIQDRFGVKGLLPFSISDTDFTSPQPIVQKLQDVVSSGLYGYTRWNHHDFKSSVTGWFNKRYGCYVNENWVVYSPSVMYTISVLIRLLSKAGESVLTLSPMYDSFPGVILGNNRRMVICPLNYLNGAYQINFKQLERLATGCRIFLLCSPHNPTGRMWTEDEMQNIIQICKKHNLYLITDEIHADIALKKRHNISALSYINSFSHIVTISSSSKIFNTPSLIGSYALIPDAHLRDAFLNQTRHVDFLNSASLLGMYATMVGYNECEYYVDGLCSYIYKNMSYIKKYFQKYDPDIIFEIPDATYLAWFNVSKLGFDSATLQNALTHIGKIAIMKGETYGADGAGFLRMCVGCPQKKLQKGLSSFQKSIAYLKDRSKKNYAI